MSIAPQAQTAAAPGFAAQLAGQGAQAGARCAALAVHALGTDDRNWLLHQLDAAQRDTLQEHLGELQQLGVPADRRMLHQALALHVVPAAPQPTAAAASHTLSAAPGGARNDLDRLATLDGAGVAALAALLAHEPAALVACLLQMRAWSWAPELLQQLPPVVRQRVSTPLPVRPNSAAPRRDAALLRTLCQRLDAAAVPHAAPAVGAGAAFAAWRGLGAARGAAPLRASWARLQRRFGPAARRSVA